MSNVASTVLPFSATMFPVLATMSNEISSFRQSWNKLNMFNLFRLCRKDEILRYSFDIVAVCGNKVLMLPAGRSAGRRARRRSARRPPGAWAVGRPTLQGGPVGLHPVQGDILLCLYSAKLGYCKDNIRILISNCPVAKYYYISSSLASFVNFWHEEIGPNPSYKKVKKTDQPMTNPSDGLTNPMAISAWYELVLYSSPT